MGNGKLTVCFHTRGWVARWKREMGNCSPTRDARDQVGNGKWEIGFGCVKKAKWEMGNGKLPSGKLDAVQLPAFGKRETGNWLLNLPRRDMLKNTVRPQDVGSSHPIICTCVNSWRSVGIRYTRGSNGGACISAKPGRRLYVYNSASAWA